MQMAITGGSGLLGSALRRILETRGHGARLVAWRDALTLSPADIATALGAGGAEVLVHCAADTNVERCEDTPVAAFRDNVLVPEVFAAACARAGLRMVLISSTGVYGAGQDGPWTERDTPAPTTVHHRSKLAAEQCVQATMSGSLVIRTGWLFGGVPAGRRDFVTARLEDADKNERLVSNLGQFGNPTFVDDVVHTLMQLLAGGYSGVFNCVNYGRASRHEYVREILKLGGRKTILEGLPASAFPRNAPVSHNESAENWKLDALGLKAPGDWRQALARYMTENGLTP